MGEANGSDRLERLRRIIEDVHAGMPVDLVKPRLAKLVSEVSHEELVSLEQKLIREGMSPKMVRGICDLHSSIVREQAEGDPLARVPAGHPVDTFRRSHRAIAGEVDRMERVMERILAGEGDIESLLEEWRAALERLLEVDKHYLRKENLLFPFLERHGIHGPSQVMWAKHDEIRKMLRRLRDELARDDRDLAHWQYVARELGIPLGRAILEMISKEEKILLPLALQKLAAGEWGEIWRELPRYPFSLVQPSIGWMPPPTPDKEEPTASPVSGKVFLGSSGSVTPRQLRAILRTLPLDLTFVDADDRVAFFSHGPDPIFDRAPTVIGRKVQFCHPPSSVHLVEKILQEFRAGTRDSATFWIRMGERYVLIRYYAVRDGSEYLGALEVTQDIAPLREIEGERRLLAED